MGGKGDENLGSSSHRFKELTGAAGVKRSCKNVEGGGTLKTYAGNEE